MKLIAPIVSLLTLLFIQGCELGQKPEERVAAQSETQSTNTIEQEQNRERLEEESSTQDSLSSGLLSYSVQIDSFTVGLPRYQYVVQIGDPYFASKLRREDFSDLRIFTKVDTLHYSPVSLLILDSSDNVSIIRFRSARSITKNYISQTVMLDSAVMEIDFKDSIYHLRRLEEIKRFRINN